MPRRGPSEADLYLLYGFASALVFLMGIIIVMRSRGRRMYDVEARGVALDWDGLKHLYRTGTYDVREREAWDSPAARATLTGIPPLKRASKQKRERQERKERRRRRREARDTPRDDLEAGVDVADIVTAAADAVGLTAPRLQLAMTADLTAVAINAQGLRRVLTNLLENAARHGRGAPVGLLREPLAEAPKAGIEAVDREEGV